MLMLVYVFYNMSLSLHTYIYIYIAHAQGLQLITPAVLCCSSSLRGTPSDSQNMMLPLLTTLCASGW